MRLEYHFAMGTKWHLGKERFSSIPDFSVRFANLGPHCLIHLKYLILSRQSWTLWIACSKEKENFFGTFAPRRLSVVKLSREAYKHISTQIIANINSNCGCKAIISEVKTIFATLTAGPLEYSACEGLQSRCKCKTTKHDDMALQIWWQDCSHVLLRLLTSGRHYQVAYCGLWFCYLRYSWLREFVNSIVYEFLWIFSGWAKHFIFWTAPIVLCVVMLISDDPSAQEHEKLGCEVHVSYALHQLQCAHVFLCDVGEWIAAPREKPQGYRNVAARQEFWRSSIFFGDTKHHSAQLRVAINAWGLVHLLASLQTEALNENLKLFRVVASQYCARSRRLSSILLHIEGAYQATMNASSIYPALLRLLFACIRNDKLTASGVSHNRDNHI